MHRKDETQREWHDGQHTKWSGTRFGRILSADMARDVRLIGCLEKDIGTIDVCGIVSLTALVLRSPPFFPHRRVASHRFYAEALRTSFPSSRHHDFRRRTESFRTGKWKKKKKTSILQPVRDKFVTTTAVLLSLDKYRQGKTIEWHVL